MRKFALLVAVLFVIPLLLFKVKAHEYTGFVGPDILWESDSFYSVYNQSSGNFLVNVNVDENILCLFNAPCIPVKGLPYFGDIPQKDDMVQVKEYFIWFRWEDPEQVGNICHLTLANRKGSVS